MYSEAITRFYFVLIICIWSKNVEIIGLLQSVRSQENSLHLVRDW